MEINLGNTIPIFAHDVAMSTVTKAKKTKKGKAKKESFTELVFIDAVRKSAIARIILPMSVLEGMPEMIEENLKKIKTDLKDNEMPKEKEKVEIKKENSYLG
ncbi:MAG: hypothetical protein PHQ66_03220 [Candidatus Nanoarchaeia archaeon]|nr:hypothetical protein [Candidatus Nanoarchaeia archaeon]MDD5357625.1 hypothetical protein [Candidatus Nanoarchaeia archaeon]MDD5588544.1 hypothetical protein [Candidatus Nanoarchaeia archaeon]